MAFVARTHPQQGYNEQVDDRATTWEDFTPLHERYRFTVDVAASERNTKLPRFYTRADDGLAQSWASERVWCNPPFSSIRPWVEKAWAETVADLVVMILPANRTEQGWWQELIEPRRDQGGRLATRFYPGRWQFVPFDDDVIRPNSRPPFGIVVAVWGADPPPPQSLTIPQALPMLSADYD